MRVVLVSVLMLAYPGLVYFGLARFEPRVIALLLAAVALLRALATRERVWMVAAAGGIALSLIAAAANDATALKLYPVLVNASLLVLFAASLLHPPSLIERLARLQQPDLPPAAVAYTRRVTQVWCGFFVLNGSIALYTALYASAALWALYNGLVAYLLMGVLFAGEWLVRRRVRGVVAHG
ncbi:MAG: hypothetical protein HYV17_04485 [Xanthomonadales bacterium]|nr:hypothetical protein [Xanthomonadales bacterium]